jgi:peptidoglycan hydrolase CwlO-like protein
MKRTLLAALAALTVSVSASAFALTVAAAESDQQPSRAGRMQQWAADRETMLDAKLAGMKAGLQLTADQEKLWPPFESAVKDAAKAHMDAMRQMMQAR